MQQMVNNHWSSTRTTIIYQLHTYLTQTSFTSQRW